MKSSFKILISIAVLSVFSIACSSKKKAQKVDCISINSLELMENIKQNAPIFKSYSSKLDAKITSKGNAQDLKISVRINKDSAIWSSVKVMSIPVALSIISQDSVKALIKQPKKQYLAAEIKYLQERFNIDVNYTTLENIFTGQPILFDSTHHYIVMCKEDELWIKSHTTKEAEKAIKKPASNNEYIVNYLVNKESFQIERIDAIRTIDESRLIVNYNQFETIENQAIPSKTSAYFYGVNDTLTMEFKSSKIKLNQSFSMPFNRTDSYEEIIIK